MRSRRSPLRARRAALVLALALSGPGLAASPCDFTTWLARVPKASAPKPAIDSDGAMRLARQDRCLACHAVARSLEGPSFVAVAEKYRDRAGAAEKLVARFAVGERVRLADGRWEEHRAASASDVAEVRNLVRWILAQ